MKAKLLMGGFILIILVLGVAQYTKLAIANGGLEQSNTNLNQTVKDNEKNYTLIRQLSRETASTLIKTEKEKATLNRYALKKAHELEILKNENADIKKWAVVIMPNILGYKLYDTAYNTAKTGLHTNPNGVITADTRATIDILNENLYQYAIDAVTALRMCNVDKASVLESYNKIKEKIEKHNE